MINQISKIVVVTFAGKLNHVCSLLKPQELRDGPFLSLGNSCIGLVIWARNSL